MALRPISWLRGAVFGAALVPAGLLVVGFFTDDLTANPIEYITHQTGYWALVLLVASLAVTPLRRLSGWNDLIRLRRMVGLFAFFYATLHLLTWVVLDKFFDWPWMLEDIVERRFITVGMVSWALMLPLAVTSTQGMIRRLGRRWQQLHRAAYGAAVAGVVHYWWLVKADVQQPQAFAVVLTLLLVFRAWWTSRSSRRAAARQRTAP